MHENEVSEINKVEREDKIMLTCHEALTLLYDLQTMRTDPHAEPDKRGSKLALAKAHILTCVMCNDFFEQERAYVKAVHDRIVHIHQPMPLSVLSNTLQLVQQARVEELQFRPTRSISQRIAGFVRSIFGVG